jgi:hypothetical protein
MTSPSRRPDSPVESVELTISFRADRATSKKIKEAVPSARIKGGGCEVRISAQDPGEVAEWAKDVLEKVRGVENLRR